ncbi:hypothetical protein ABZ858_20550 [Streptomyces sp. NPDC047017]|uniref:hypothetical protein n=1 Tax=Streptomyces sp. NPDC047017 TaxID=3155024 RepID=UPI0033D59D3A
MDNLRELCERVLRDLSVGVNAVPSVTFSAAESDGYTEIFLQDETGMGVGFLVDASAPEAEILYEMAYRIPDAYVDFHAIGLPVVPGTGRPAVPRVVADTVVWEDPNESGSWSCPVGRYRLAWEQWQEDCRH